MQNLYDIESPERFHELLSQDIQRVSLINFWAEGMEPCIQMNKVVVELAKKYPQLLVLQVEAQQQSYITESFDIDLAPTFLVLRGHILLARIIGANTEALTQAVETHTRAPPPASSIAPLSKTSQSPAAPPEQKQNGAEEESQEQLEQRIRGLTTRSPIVLFMKGSPDAPRCGFSKRIVALLRKQSVDFDHFDILTDGRVREGLKALNNWPTYPQLIVKGEFVGGLDVVQEMVDSGELAEMLA